MQQLLTGILFIALHTALIAQPTTENLSLEQPELRILYVGIANEIKVNFLEHNGAIELKTNSTKARIFKMDSCLFHVYPDYSSRMSTEVLEIYSGTRLVETDTFAIHRLPNPEVRLGTISDSIASIAQILENPELRVVFPNTYLKHYCTVHSFTLFVKRDGSETPLPPSVAENAGFDTIYTISPITAKDTMVVIESTGEPSTETGGYMLTKNQINHIKQLGSGDILVFMTRVVCPNSATRSLTLRIKIR